MRNVLSVPRISSTDAVAIDEKMQLTTTEAINALGDAVVGAPVIDAASALKTAAASLEQI